MTHNLIAPTINVNDDKIVLGSIDKQNLDYIQEGEVLCCFETSKATEDFKCEYSGYLLLTAEIGDEILVGSTFGFVFDTKEEAEIKMNESLAVEAAFPDGFKASKKAIEYAKSLGFNITLIKKNGLIKTEDIDNYLANNKTDDKSVLSEPSSNSSSVLYKSNDVVLVGGGGLALMVIDAIHSSCQYNIVGIVDDYAKPGDIVYGYKVLGAIDATLKQLYDKGLRVAVNCIGAMTSSQSDPLFFARKQMAEKVKSFGYILPNVIHPKAIVEPSCRLGEGNIILACANIGSRVVIGDNCYINTNTMISHECVLGNGVKVAPGAILAGRINVGDNSLIGMGATVYMNVKIGANTVIFNGVNVFSNISDGKTVEK
jgi:sugar O-acyltransferase (sialic acid O-acetyltransferase NeuD family)